jgi:hypothetical protein
MLTKHICRRIFSKETTDTITIKYHNTLICASSRTDLSSYTASAPSAPVIIK